MLKWDLFGDKFRESWGFFWVGKKGVFVLGCVKWLIGYF